MDMAQNKKNKPSHYDDIVTAAQEELFRATQEQAENCFGKIPGMEEIMEGIRSDLNASSETMPPQSGSPGETAEGRDADGAAEAVRNAALRAVQEQMQALYGNMPEVGMPDPADLQAQIQAQLKAAVPGLGHIQAQQAAMNTLGGSPEDEIEWTAQYNRITAQQFMDVLQDGSLQSRVQAAYEAAEETGTGAGDTDERLAAAFGDWFENIDMDEEWTIERADDGKLNDGQLYLLAFGAPLLVYNSEQVDSCESEYDTGTIQEQMKSWWGIEDRQTTLEIADWLLNEGHHAEADEILNEFRENGFDSLPDEDTDEAVADVRLIVETMLREGYCTKEEIPRTAIAWDLVRLVNVGRWTYQCGYITYGEMWQMMQTAVDAARKHFSSWEEYGRSFVLGRGVWHGDPDDCKTAYGIVGVLLEQVASPWKRIAWNKE